MYTYALKNPLEKDGIEFVDIVEPTGGSPEFNKACAALAGQFIYSQRKFAESPAGKEMLRENEPELRARAEEIKKKADANKGQEGEDLEDGSIFESAKGTNNLLAGADKDYIVNITSKFSDVYKRNPKVLQFNGAQLNQLQFNSLSWYDLSILATAYCHAFMQG